MSATPIGKSWNNKKGRVMRNWIYEAPETKIELAKPIEPSPAPFAGAFAEAERKRTYDTSLENCRLLADHSRVWKSAEADESADLIEELAHELKRFKVNYYIMSFITFLNLLLFLYNSNAHADEIPPSAAPEHHCISNKDWMASLAKSGATFQGMRGAQFEFLRGVSAMSPITPPGLPLGDRAVLVTLNGANTIMFMDDDWVCDPMPAPDGLVKLLQDVGEGVMKHQGDGT